MRESFDLPSPVLITGVNGFIAGHLAERLVAYEVAVRGVARRPESARWLAEQRVDVRLGDLLQADSLRGATEGCRAVVHAAAWTGGAGLKDAEAWRTNVEGTANALAAAQEAGVERFVYISSVAVYGVNRAPMIDEDMATPPVGQLYPDSKIAAEKKVRESGMPYVIIRPASTYGPRGTAWTVGPIEAIRHGNLVLLGRDTGLVTPGYVDNVVDGLCLALKDPAALGEAFNLCDDRAVTYHDFYMTYAQMLGKRSLPTLPARSVALTRLPGSNVLRRLMGKPVAGPWSRHFRTNPSQFSIAKAQRVLGYAPQIDFGEGMRRTEAWLRAEGYLS